MQISVRKRHFRAQ
uniref:Uncharacterized protein n=1 Tax=Romanomermis culicivorax TaxID=13658 RepID=A0A915L445_ROMCU